MRMIRIHGTLSLLRNCFKKLEYKKLLLVNLRLPCNGKLSRHRTWALALPCRVARLINLINNLWPKLHILSCLIGLIRPLFVHCEKIKKERKTNRAVLELLALPQPKLKRLPMSVRFSLLFYGRFSMDKTMVLTSGLYCNYSTIGLC